ncbi:hypothetical protein GU253_14315 [Vibrio cholerae]|nr:hypothetical protein [Vibrio paracholerae]RBM73462.1 hypothetical protein DLR68_16295 [Vibrio paracholerae]
MSAFCISSSFTLAQASNFSLAEDSASGCHIVAISFMLLHLERLNLGRKLYCARINGEMRR